MPFFPRECGINMGFMGFKLLIRTNTFSDGCFASPWLSTDESRRKVWSIPSFSIQSSALPADADTLA